ncbi:uncharacterized protein LOC123554366 [Mercenaria mercenaria]|uniref:uncharacterized protein LOC123554366 n=1 Tax=Mercenaria mercenaria TaxID=6596 RepID=UPI00234EEEE3|nr:uncharacterized protein LOC123554366 [Mercenaria mercenaria]
MNKDDTLWIVVAVCCAVLFIMTVLIAFIAFKRFCGRRSGPPRVIRQNAENQSPAVIMSDIEQNDNISDQRQVEQYQNDDNMMQEQVFQIYNESPRPEPSAPPLPPEYYMEYT